MVYTRPVYTYELDGMGIVHHANYIRYFEEARLDAMRRLGYGYERLTAMETASPVMALSVQYLHPAVYPDVLSIEIRLLAYDGVRFRFGYTVVNQDGVKLLTGETAHCLTGKSGLPIRIPRQLPEVHTFLKEWLARDGVTESPR